MPCHLINNKDFLFFCVKFSRYNEVVVNLARRALGDAMKV